MGPYSDRTGVLLRRGGDTRNVHTKRPGDGTERGRLSTNQEERSH